MLTAKVFILRMNMDTYKALEKWAADEFRSVNGQIEFLLDKNLSEAKRKKMNEAIAIKTKVK